MKTLIVFLTSILLSTYALAQNNALEAKAAYLLAEEEFNNGKFENAIKYLDEAGAKLGSPNAKILYLKILAEAELAKKDTGYIIKVLRTIDAFQIAPDIADFNEDKALEISKLKFRLKEARNLALEQQRKKLEYDSVFSQVAVDNWKIGLPLEEAEKLDERFFKKAKRSVSGNNLSFVGKQQQRDYYTAHRNLQEKNGIFQLQFVDNRLTYFYKIWILEGDDKFTRTNELIKSITSQVMLEPKIDSTTTTELVNKGDLQINTTTITYSWMSDNKRIALIVDRYHNLHKQKNSYYHSEINLRMTKK